MQSRSRLIPILFFLLTMAPAGGAAQPSPTPAAPPPRLLVRAEVRERVESLAGASFVPARDDAYWLTRVRVDATVTPLRQLRFFGQLQDGRVADKSVPPFTAPFSAPIDLRQAWGEVGTPMSWVSVRAGRQELAYGDQRLLGHLNWTNAARTFDAVRGTWRPRGWQVDVFEASVVRSLHDLFDRSGAGSHLTGIYGTGSRWWPNVDVEPFLLWRREQNQRGELGAVGRLSAATLGVRLARRPPARTEWATEMAIQRGSLAGDDVRAWAGHWRVRQLVPGRGNVHVSSEFNTASGDRSPTDGVRGTFDQLFPTGHDKYGLADLVGWKNVHHVRLGLDLAPVRALPIAINYHSWWLASARDALYAANSAVVARLPAKAAVDGNHPHVGQELDVQVARRLTRELQAVGGVAHIFPGRFLTAATPGAAHTFGYAQVVLTVTGKR